MQIQHCLIQAASQLTGVRKSDSSRIDVEVLLCHVIQQPRSYLFSHSDEILSEPQLTQFNLLLQRRLAGEPVAYIVGYREFWSRRFRVNSSVLIPRPETECLVERMLQLDLPGNARVLDLGVGSGAIAITLAGERPDWHCIGIDSSEKALAIAHLNRGGLLSRSNCSLIAGDWLSAIVPQSADLVVSNPPYIEVADPHLEEGDVRFEPRSALASGDDGMDAIRAICLQAREVLVPGGYIVVEHGWRQQQQVVELLATCALMDIECGKDLAGLPRFVLARQPDC